jgi:hypothetical protein
VKLPGLPKLLARKIYKTGQTRGADDDEIYQNRVSRTNTVLIPYALWEKCREPGIGKRYAKGSIVLINPVTYFEDPNIGETLARQGLELGKNALVFYEKREDWVAHSPDKLGWRAANRRGNDLGGQYVARISATTGSDGKKIAHGFTTTKNKGAGIRVYEYADAETIESCGTQLEGLFWLCADSVDAAIAGGMSREDAVFRKAAIIQECEQKKLLEIQKLKALRIVNLNAHTVCPLCLSELSGLGFLTRQAQAPGREVHDLTITEVNLFHIEELKHTEFNHRQYNLGWGHHHCNIVVKDAGIEPTLAWMRSVIAKNDEDN